MSCYYAVPVKRDGRTLTYNVFDGNCAIASTPHDAYLQLGAPDAGEMFAVWRLNRELGLILTGEMCALVAPTKIFIVVEGGEMFPLDIDPVLGVSMEVPDAGRD